MFIKSRPSGFMNGMYRSDAVEMTKKATRIENLALRSMLENILQAATSRWGWMNDWWTEERCQPIFFHNIIVQFLHSCKA